MKGQQRLYQAPERPERPCVLCGQPSTHEARWRRSTWVQLTDLCQPCSSLAVCSDDPPYRLHRFVPEPKRQLPPEATLPLDL